MCVWSCVYMHIRHRNVKKRGVKDLRETDVVNL